MRNLKSSRLHYLTERIGFHVRKLRNSPTSYCRLLYEDLLNFHRAHDAGRPFTIFDIGANAGQSAYVFSKWFPAARIFSVEPFSSTFQQLKQNARHLRAVTIENLGFGDTEETVEVPLFDERDPANEQNSILWKRRHPDQSVVQI